MNRILYRWHPAALRLEGLEDRTAPAGFNSLLSRAEPALFGDTANGTSYVQYDPVSGLPFARQISADGRYTAFLSLAENVIPGQVDSNEGYDVFLYDRVANTTVLVSGANGSATETGNGKSVVNQAYANGGFPGISADGRFVTFTSTATNIVPGFIGSSGSPQNIYVYDRTTAQCKLVSHRYDSMVASSSAINEFPIISGNGQVIAFRSKAVDLIAGLPNPGGTSTAFQHAYAYDVTTEQISLLDHKYGSANLPANNAGLVLAMTPNGQQLLVTSFASDMLEQTSASLGDVYLHDRQTGSNLLVSRSSSAAPYGGNGRSDGIAISADGKWVCLLSFATNLVPGMTSTARQVLLYDVDANEMRLVSHTANSSLAGGNDWSQGPGLSADGRYVAFNSKANDLIAGYVDGNTANDYDTFIYDRDTDQTSLVNRVHGSVTVSANASSTSQLLQISTDGRYVLFADKSSNLVSGFIDGNGSSNHDLFRFDRTTGTVALVSSQDNSSMVSANGRSYYAAMSADGQHIAMTSEANDLSSTIADNNGLMDVYVRDMTTGATSLASRRFGIGSLSAGGEGFWIDQTPDGRFVVFCDTANNLVPGQVEITRDTSDVFLLDRQTNTTILVSHAAGLPATEGNYDSGLPVISADGRYVAYASYATDLVGGFVDANGLGSYATDVFLYDRLTGINQLVSRQAGTTNVGGNDSSGSVFSSSAQISISGDGQWVCFQSHATDLINGFINNNGKGYYAAGADIFLFDRQSGNVLLPNHLPGQPAATGNGMSLLASISNDGRYVAYRSESTNTIAGMTSASSNVLLYDRMTDTNFLVNHIAPSPTTASNNGADVPVISRNGNFILYMSYSNNLMEAGIDNNDGPDIFLYDRQSGTNMLVSHATGSATVAGNRPSFQSATSDYHLGRFISADGRYVVYQSEAQDLVSGFVDGNGIAIHSKTDIYLFDRVTGSNTLVSRTAATATKSGNGESYSPTISGDGRFVAFISGATDLVNGFIGTLPPQGQIPHVFVYDRVSGLTKLVSHDSANSLLGAYYDFPGAPVINANGSVIAYTSSSSDLVAGDINGFQDVFAYVTPPPRVTSVQINDGTAQRSNIRSLTITFDDYVFIDSGPLTLVNSQGQAVGGVQWAVEYQDNSTFMTVTFSGANTEFGSLADGNYELRVLGSQVSGVGFLDGNGDGVGGDDYTFTFHRLFGDSNGDRKVNSIDFTALRGAFGLGGITFDFNNDGIVNATDFAQFRARFGLQLAP